jgi:hypothetical protein
MSGGRAADGEWGWRYEKNPTDVRPITFSRGAEPI